MEIDDNSQPHQHPQPQPIEEDLFGPVIYAYTRAQALADGEQVDGIHRGERSGNSLPNLSDSWSL